MPPKRRGRKQTKQTTSSNANPDNHNNVEQPQNQTKPFDWVNQDVERKCGAIRAMREVEIDQILTELRLLKSRFSEAELKTHLAEFVREKFPNLLIEKSGSDDGGFDVKWKDKDGNLSMNYLDENGLNASLLRRISMAYPGCSFDVPGFGGCNFSGQTDKTNILDVGALQIRKFALEEPSDSQLPGMPDAFRTPGASSQRLSVGMTPKTVRVPKHGEMLLSVHGSPLGVYKEDNMEAISEAEEG